jgi:hypothetical protein
VVRFTTRPLYPQGKSPGTHWIGNWVGSRAGIEALAKRKIPTSCRDTNLDHPARSPVVVAVVIAFRFVEDTAA